MSILLLTVVQTPNRSYFPHLSIAESNTLLSLSHSQLAEQNLTPNTKRPRHYLYSKMSTSETTTTTVPTAHEPPASMPMVDLKIVSVSGAVAFLKETPLGEAAANVLSGGEDPRRANGRPS